MHILYAYIWLYIIHDYTYIYILCIIYDSICICIHYSKCIWLSLIWSSLKLDHWVLSHIFFLTIHTQIILDPNINLMKLCPVQQAMLCSCWNLQVSWLGAGPLVIDAGDARFKDLQQLSGLNWYPRMCTLHVQTQTLWNTLKYCENKIKPPSTKQTSTSRPQSPYH